MIINKDNVTDYQISHIGSNHEERLEVCRILESFGQEVSSTTSFKHTTTISKLFNRDIFHLDGSTYSLVSVKPYLKTVTPKEFIQMATTITITKDNIRNYAIQKVESKSIREQAVLALQKLGEKTTSVRDTVFTHTKVEEDDYFSWNGRLWETHGSSGIGTIGLKPSEFLKAIAHLLLSTNPRDYAIETIGDALIRQQVIEALNAANEPMHRSSMDFPKSKEGFLFFLNGYWTIPINPNIGKLTSVTPESFLKMHNAGKFVYEARPKSLTVLDQFLAGPIPTDNRFIKYVHQNKLGEELLKVIEDGKGVNRPYPYASGKNIDFNLIFCWDRTPQGPTFWSRHDDNMDKSVDGGLLTKYLEAYKEARSGVMPKAVENMTNPIKKLPSVVAGQIYTYNKTKTKYRVRVASVSSNSYTLETLTTNRTADWCKDISLDRVHEIFTLHTDIPSAPSPSCPEATTPFKVGDMVRIRHDAKIDEVYGSKIPITLLRAMYFSGTKKIDEIHKDYCIISGFGYAYEMIEPAVEEDLPLQIMRDAITSIKTSTAPVIGPKLDQVVDGTISTCTLSRIGTPIYFDSTAAISVGALASRTELTLTKGKPMPKTLKDNAVELVQENKAAAFTAAEIKAGQIINKQAISLIKPKLPMMVRGYADSPVASVVLANVVALGLKHYAAGNKKLEKISELMIAGAAFDSIDALNIDGIVNDFIAGLKLPAGVEIE